MQEHQPRDQLSDGAASRRVVDDPGMGSAFLVQPEKVGVLGDQYPLSASGEVEDRFIRSPAAVALGR